MDGTAIIVAGAAAVALGSWMNWHPPAGERWQAEWSNVEEIKSPSGSYKIYEEQAFKVRYNPYYAKNIVPANWMRLAIAGPVPPYFTRYVENTRGEKEHAGVQNEDISVSASITISGETIGPFPVDWWYYNEYKTYDKAIILQVVSAMRASDEPAIVRMTYSGGWAARGDYKTEFKVPAGVLPEPPKATLFDKASAAVMPAIRSAWDAHKTREEEARWRKIQKDSARRWRNKVAKSK